MAVKACNYKNFSTGSLFASCIATIASFTKSHACKFSTLWKTSVDNHFGAIRHSRTAAARYRCAHCLIQPSPSSHSTLAGTYMRAKKKSIRPLDALRVS